MTSRPWLDHRFAAPPLVHLVRLAGLQRRRKSVPSGFKPVSSGRVISEAASARGCSDRGSKPRSSGGRPISLWARLGVVERRLSPGSGHRRSFSTWQRATSPPLISRLRGRWRKARSGGGYERVSKTSLHPMKYLLTSLGDADTDTSSLQLAIAPAERVSELVLGRKLDVAKAFRSRSHLILDQSDRGRGEVSEKLSEGFFIRFKSQVSDKGSVGRDGRQRQFFSWRSASE